MAQPQPARRLHTLQECAAAARALFPPTTVQEDKVHALAQALFDENQRVFLPDADAAAPRVLSGDGHERRHYYACTWDAPQHMWPADDPVLRAMSANDQLRAHNYTTWLQRCCAFYIEMAERDSDGAAEVDWRRPFETERAVVLKDRKASERPPHHLFSPELHLIFRVIVCMQKPLYALAAEGGKRPPLFLTLYNVEQIASRLGDMHPEARNFLMSTSGVSGANPPLIETVGTMPDFQHTARKLRARAYDLTFIVPRTLPMPLWYPPDLAPWVDCFGVVPSRFTTRLGGCRELLDEEPVLRGLLDTLFLFVRRARLAVTSHATPAQREQFDEMTAWKERDSSPERLLAAALFLLRLPQFKPAWHPRLDPAVMVPLLKRLQPPELWLGVESEYWAFPENQTLLTELGSMGYAGARPEIFTPAAGDASDSDF